MREKARDLLENAGLMREKDTERRKFEKRRRYCGA